MAGEPDSNADLKNLELKLRVTLAADRNAIDPVVQSIMQVVRETECAVGKEEAIELALSEALANAVIHGAQGDPLKVVECDVACEDRLGMLIIVRDPGPGFDPSRVPNPLEGENIFSHHGRGIFLINQLMDEVQFKNNGKEIHMRKK